MLPLARLWAQIYMVEHSGISVYVEGGGTGTGAEALADGKVDICTASRPLQAREAQALAERFGTVGVSVLAAKDALSIYVNLENQVHAFTKKQLADIFTGRIKNWIDLGGDDAPIQLLTRLPSSGTYLYLKEHIMNGDDYSASAKTLPTTKAVIDYVAAHKYAIGYGGIAYESNVRHCRIDGVEPTAEHVADDSYPLTRYLYLYTVDTPTGRIKDFVNWVLSEHGQDIVKWVGYFPIWE